LDPKAKIFERIAALIAGRQSDPGGAGPIHPIDVLRLAMRQMRQELKSGAASPGPTAAEQLNRKRFARNKTQERFKVLRRRPAPPMPKLLMIAKFRESPILDALLPDRKDRWVRILDRNHRRGAAEVKLEDFSFFTDPDKTMSGLKQIAEIETCEVGSQVHFQDDVCIDIGPYLVLAEAWPALAPVITGGRMMPPVQKVLRAVGLQNRLGFRFDVQDERDVWAFPLQRRRPANTSSSANLNLEPQRRERVADGLCVAIDKWLGMPVISQELSDEGRAWISNIVGELLDNAERHSRPPGKDGEWSIAAFMARRVENGEDVFRCYLGFLSVGSTIAETIATGPARVVAAMKRYCAMHSDCGASADALSTLFALQDAVTRDHNADAGGRGGYGFQEVLDMVSILGHTEKPGREPHVTIISGKACIRLRPPYLKGDRNGVVDGPRVLWCNDQNSSTIRPDADFVFDLEERLAGTIISVAFTLDPDYYNATSDDGGNDDVGN
jgi:hypothetical protein